MQHLMQQLKVNSLACIQTPQQTNAEQAEEINADEQV